MDETDRPAGPTLPRTPLATEDQFYAFLAGGARHALLLSAVDLGLPSVLAGGALTLEELVSLLGMTPYRADKYISLLVGVGLVEHQRDAAGGPSRYASGPLLSAISSPDLATGYFYREFLRYWRFAYAYDPVAIVRGAPVPFPVRYPPTDMADTELLHHWMRSGALVTLASLIKRYDFATSRRLLDVGGGDATMACELARNHPELVVTVFNVPQAAQLANQTISASGLTGRVSVHVGDFRTDALPTGYDTVLFSRVLADWPPNLCRELVGKAFNSLTAGGTIILCEPLRDQNPELSIAWEHSYLPYDDFGAHTYKTAAFYTRILEQAGFVDVRSQPRKESIHGVIFARRP